MSELLDFRDLPELPNRLAVAEFNPKEVMKLTGTSLEDQITGRDNFNWVAAYLVEEVGLHEEELADWFRSSAAGLDDRRPIDVWPQPDGFVSVFDYAQQYNEQVLEDIGEDPRGSYQRGIERGQRLGVHAVRVIADAFQAAGGESIEWVEGRDYAIHNPGRSNELVASWRPGNEIHHFRIDKQSVDSSHLSRFFVVFGVLDGQLEVFQCGIGEFMRVDGHDFTDVNSDLDGRPPTVGQVASFVIPLANAAKNRTLEMV